MRAKEIRIIGNDVEVTGKDGLLRATVYVMEDGRLCIDVRDLMKCEGIFTQYFEPCWKGGDTNP